MNTFFKQRKVLIKETKEAIAQNEKIIEEFGDELKTQFNLIIDNLSKNITSTFETLESDASQALQTLNRNFTENLQNSNEVIYQNQEIVKTLIHGTSVEHENIIKTEVSVCARSDHWYEGGTVHYIDYVGEVDGGGDDGDDQAEDQETKPNKYLTVRNSIVRKYSNITGWLEMKNDKCVRYFLSHGFGH